MAWVVIAYIWPCTLYNWHVITRLSYVLSTSYYWLEYAPYYGSNGHVSQDLYQIVKHTLATQARRHCV